MDTKDEITTACRDGLLFYEVCHRVLGRIQALGRDCESHHTRGVPGAVLALAGASCCL